jgi:hypothetical protein
MKFIEKGIDETVEGFDLRLLVGADVVEIGRAHV